MSFKICITGWLELVKCGLAMVKCGLAVELVKCGLPNFIFITHNMLAQML